MNGMRNHIIHSAYRLKGAVTISFRSWAFQPVTTCFSMLLCMVSVAILLGICSFLASWKWTLLRSLHCRSPHLQRPAAPAQPLRRSVLRDPQLTALSPLVPWLPMSPSLCQPHTWTLGVLVCFLHRLWGCC